MKSHSGYWGVKAFNNTKFGRNTMQLVKFSYLTHYSRELENKSIESVIIISLNHMRTVFMEILLLSLLNIETSMFYLKLGIAYKL